MVFYCFWTDRTARADERFGGKKVFGQNVMNVKKYELIDRHYFIPLLSSFESYLLPFLPFILDFVEAGFGFICVNLYCRLSIFLIYSLSSFINKNHLNYTAEDEHPPGSFCSAQLSPRHEMAIEISSCQLFLQR